MVLTLISSSGLVLLLLAMVAGGCRHSSVFSLCLVAL
jgi:hypothetical protein